MSSYSLSGHTATWKFLVLAHFCYHPWVAWMSTVLDNHHRSQYSPVMISLFPFSFSHSPPFSFKIYFCRLKWIRPEERTRDAFHFGGKFFGQAQTRPCDVITTKWRLQRWVVAILYQIYRISPTHRIIFLLQLSFIVICLWLMEMGFMFASRSRSTHKILNCWFREIARKTANSNLSLSLLGSYMNGMDDHGWKL